MESWAGPGNDANYVINSKDSNQSLSALEKLLPLVKLGSSCRRPHFGEVWCFFDPAHPPPGGVPRLLGFGRNARNVAK